jgi:hypothetical protein
MMPASLLVNRKNMPFSSLAVIPEDRLWSKGPSAYSMLGILYSGQAFRTRVRLRSMAFLSEEPCGAPPRARDSPAERKAWSRAKSSLQFPIQSQLSQFSINTPFIFSFARNCCTRVHVIGIERLTCDGETDARGDTYLSSRPDTFNFTELVPS